MSDTAAEYAIQHHKRQHSFSIPNVSYTNWCNFPLFFHVSAVQLKSRQTAAYIFALWNTFCFGNDKDKNIDVIKVSFFLDNPMTPHNHIINVPKITLRAFSARYTESEWNYLNWPFDLNQRPSSVRKLKTNIKDCNINPILNLTITITIYFGNVFGTIVNEDGILIPTGLPTGLQPDCLHGLRTTLRYVLVLPLSSFSWRVCRTTLAFS